MPYNIDSANPVDNSEVSAFPANERSSRDALENIIGYEHKETTGRHMIPMGTTAARDGLTDWEKGSLWYNTTTSKLEVQTAAAAPFSWSDAVAAPAPFASGTKMVFVQAAAPSGWTQVTSVNDRVLRIVSGGTGGATGGSWTISGVTVDSHVLTLAEIPAHTHSVKTGNTSSGGGSPGIGAALESSGSAGGGGGHSHGLTADGAWRPAYQDVIVCSKD